MAESRIEELRGRVRRDPGSRLFAQLAEEERKTGDLQEAIRVARDGLARHPAYPGAWLTLGRALIDSGDAEGARAALQEAVTRAPENILASRFLGQALEAVGDLRGAARQYGATLGMAPGDRELEGQLRSVERKLAVAEAGTGGRAGEGVEAVQQAAAAVETSEGAGTGGEGPPFSSPTLAELYLRQGLAQEAIDVYRRVLAEHPDDERARARLAEIASGLSSGASADGGDGAEDRRRALQRTIAGLEVLLGMTRRR